MNTEAQTVALQLLRDHPGWSDRRAARELNAYRLAASPSAVQAWRVDAGLAPFTRNVDDYPPPRLAGVWLRCGHLIHPEHLADDGRGHCDYCGTIAAIATA